MRRTLTVVGAALIALVSGVAASQAQGPPNRQRGVDAFECGPGPGMNGQGQGLQQGRGGQRGTQGAMRGRGPGMGRQDAIGRPAGPGGPGRMEGRGSALCGLDLTDDQKTQIRALQQETRKDIEALLTPEQKAKFLARRGGRAGLDQK